MRYVLFLMVAGAGLAGWSAAQAQQLMIYPAAGQSPEQQQKDEGECRTWATQTTGIDPAVLAQSPPPSGGSSSGGGERVRGATRGALGGLAIGAIAGDAGKGAGIGAIVGTMAGGRQARQNKAAQQEAGYEQQRELMNTWNRAVGTCMSGRNYTVG